MSKKYKIDVIMKYLFEHQEKAVLYIIYMLELIWLV